MSINAFEKNETRKQNKLKTAKEKLLLNIDETVLLLGISKPTLYRYLKSKKDFPKPIHVTDRKVMFSIEDINDWVKRLRSSSVCS